jgi:predicted PurR-regulated permease PerM
MIGRMDGPGRESERSSVIAVQSGAMRILATAAVLAILYIARAVLVPVTLAVMLSFLMLPLVQRLRRIGLGQTFSVLAAVLCVAVGVVAIAAVIGSQLVRMSAHLPQYEVTIRHKAEALRSLSIRRAQAVLGVSPHLGVAATPDPVQLPAVALGAALPEPPVDAPSGSLQFLQRVLASVWVPLETAGTVLVVLIFVLLEQEALRDRLIRVAGGADIRTTTNLINDAGTRLSRFFTSQFAVNVAVGGVIWIGLALLGVPHALLWATLATVLRFVPYIGIWIAALCAALFAAAVDTGWSLATGTAVLFVLVELLAGQLVEPRLFGHATGLSPLSVVIAAIFWSWLWGPIGLILSTPVTLCLLVAGRHTAALNLLDVMLGDTPALTMPQKLYQRALSGDSAEIIASARAFLKRNSVAVYCDVVLMPAVYLASVDFVAGAIDGEQQIRVRDTMLSLFASLGDESQHRSRRKRRSSVLDNVNLARALREQRERSSGRWQGPIDVPPGSVTLCVGLGTGGDELATEILVRILRHQRIDARHMLPDDIQAPPPEGASADSIAIVYVVSAFRSEERKFGADLVKSLRGRLPHAWICAVLIPGLLAALPEKIADLDDGDVDATVTSFNEAESLCLERYREAAG